jgi:hypothetical protein
MLLILRLKGKFSLYHRISLFLPLNGKPLIAIFSPVLGSILEVASGHQFTAVVVNGNTLSKIYGICCGHHYNNRFLHQSILFGHLISKRIIRKYFIIFIFTLYDFIQILRKRFRGNPRYQGPCEDFCYVNFKQFDELEMYSKQI